MGVWWQHTWTNRAKSIFRGINTPCLLPAGHQILKHTEPEQTTFPKPNIGKLNSCQHEQLRHLCPHPPVLLPCFPLGAGLNKKCKKSSFKTSFISLSLATTRTRSSWTKSRSRWSVQSGARQEMTTWVQSNNDFWFWLIVAVVADFGPFLKASLTFFYNKSFFWGTPYL